MAGFLFAMSSKDENAVSDCIKSGVYSTFVSPKWNLATYSTLGDFFAMKPGDNVYFFAKRKIYGIGEIRSFSDDVVVINNYKDDTNFFEDDSGKPLLPRNNSTDPDKIQRWIINFKPAPEFYSLGIDMDDLLDSNPTVFRMLRAFSRRSFIKFDDEENNAFKSGIFRKNISQSAIELNGEPTTLPCDNKSTLESFANKLDANGESFKDRESSLKNRIRAQRNKGRSNAGAVTEMLVEDSLIKKLIQCNQDVENVFGHWDYISHQVPASPIKPAIYMDYMDIFGYNWIPTIEEKYINRYLIIEIKKRNTKGLNEHSDVATQLMKYVDWVCQNYAGGDYSLIKAFIVDHDFKPNHMDKQQTLRKYIVTNRSPQTREWNDVSLVTYDTDEDGNITFCPYPIAESMQK